MKMTAPRRPLITIASLIPTAAQSTQVAGRRWQSTVPAAGQGPVPARELVPPTASVKSTPSTSHTQTSHNTS